MSALSSVVAKTALSIKSSINLSLARNLYFPLIWNLSMNKSEFFSAFYSYEIETNQQNGKSVELGAKIPRFQF